MPKVRNRMALLPPAEELEVDISGIKSVALASDDYIFGLVGGQSNVARALILLSSDTGDRHM